MQQIIHQLNALLHSARSLESLNLSINCLSENCSRVAERLKYLQHMSSFVRSSSTFFLAHSRFGVYSAWLRSWLLLLGFVEFVVFGFSCSTC